MSGFTLTETENGARGPRQSEVWLPFDDIAPYVSVRVWEKQEYSFAEFGTDAATETETTRHRSRIGQCSADELEAKVAEARDSGEARRHLSSGRGRAQVPTSHCLAKKLQFGFGLFDRL